MYELVKQNSQCPDINHLIMRHLLHHLWGHILKGAQESLPLSHRLFRMLYTATEITDL
jgi:hypothetical protein